MDLSQTDCDQLIRQIHQRAAALLGAHADATGDPPPAPHAARLATLADRFELSRLEWLVVVALYAGEYDPLLRLLARSVQGSSAAGLEVGTLVELLDLPRAEVPRLAALLDPAGPFAEWLLAADPRPGAGTATATAMAVMRQQRLEPRVARYLARLDDEAGDVPVVRAQLRPLAPSLVAVAEQLRRALAAGERPVLQIVGAAGVGRRALAAQMAALCGLPLVAVDLSATAHPTARARAARLEARLQEAALCLTDWGEPADRAHDDGERRAAAHPQLAQLLAGRSGLTILCNSSTAARALRGAGITLVEVTLAFPTPAERTAVLQKETALRGLAAPLDDLEILARRFALPQGRLQAAVHAAAAARTAAGQPLDLDALSIACRAQLDHELDGIADRVTTGARLTDVVVSDEIAETLGEMVGFVRDAKKVRDDWGFGRHHTLGESVSALFAGPPGTGKTMCASVIANELSTELFRVDLSRVMSKWVGETEKNLGRVFDEAERSSSILLFDEADSLFGKRTAVQTSSDRYANLAVNFLLQRLETFRGIAILTTNHETAIDPAFKRRLTFRVRFEKPDLAARVALWRKVFPPTAQLAPDIDFPMLAQLADLSGAAIRNAAVRAAFLAAARGSAIDMAACATAALREAAEMGMLSYRAEDAETRVLSRSGARLKSRAA